MPEYLPLKVKSRGDVVLGLTFVIMSLTALILLRNLSAGSTSQMGPAYFPRALAIILGILGGAILFKGFTQAEELELKVRVWPMAVVVVGTVLFGLVIEEFGSVLSIFGMTLVYTFAYPGKRVLESVLLAVGTAIGATLLFVVLLDLHLSIWPRFLE